ncbi:MAG: hypothetical protein U5K37_10210 [Natrialbaceae archaeon]|nr:hypothetical protein [Natrialbaceae archaeon]
MTSVGPGERNRHWLVLAILPGVLGLDGIRLAAISWAFYTTA